MLLDFVKLKTHVKLFRSPYRLLRRPRGFQSIAGKKSNSFVNALS